MEFFNLIEAIVKDIVDAVIQKENPYILNFTGMI
jgi:hypothetical protein